MDAIIATLLCSVLAFSVAVPQNDILNVTDSFPTTSTTTTVTPSVISNSTDNTTPFTSMTSGNETINKTTATPTKGSTHFQTTLSTTTTTPQTNHTSHTSATPGTKAPTSAALTTPSVQTTGGYITSPDTTVKTTAGSPHTVSTTPDSMFRTTQGLGLSSSEINMTIVFSVILGVFAMAIVLFMFQKCKHKIQYLPQPLTNSDDADAFVTDEDTLVISGGLYDGHPIYDNVPTAQERESQFRLEFLH